VTIAIDVHLPADQAAAMARDVREGLARTPKELSPKYFYDERGSILFEAITELEEYYPTRRERQILEARSAEIVAAAGEPATLIELGSGSAAKTRHLLDAMRAAGSLRTYVPVDISEEITRQTAAELVEEYPGLDVHGLVCDFEAHLERTPTTSEAGPRLIAFLGGTIGNLYPDERADFLCRIAGLLDPGDHLLLGTDLVKDPARLELAYDDPGGVTAEFNKNVLGVLNRALGGDFDPDAFEHLARWDARHEWMDIGLRSLADQDARLADLDLTVHFDAGETMRTEISTKFTRPRLEESYAGTGLAMADWFTDPDGDYALSLAKLAVGETRPIDG
jgi:L-histidine N-alpha-methyltransferase